MQIMGVTGKIYGLKSGQTSNGKDKVSFRVGVRKQFVTDADKQNKTTMTFIPCMANGPTAKFINDFFNDGDSISVGSMEYQTYRSKNADPNNNFDDAHIFKVNSVGFVGDNSGGGNNAGGQQRQQSNNNQRQNSNDGGNQRQQQSNQRQNSNQRQTVPTDNNVDNSYIADDDLPF